jgi:phage terminase Nu1 subunit (DNA packaging protein)
MPCPIIIGRGRGRSLRRHFGAMGSAFWLRLKTNVIENEGLSTRFDRSVTELVRQAERFTMELAQYQDSAARTRTKNGSKKGTVSQSSPPYSSA